MLQRRNSLLPATLLCLLAGCSLGRAPQLPVADRVELDQLVIHSDFDVPQQQQLVAELTELRRRMTSELQLSESVRPVHVYLFKTPKRYRTFMRKHYDHFPDRRALFMETNNKLNVYAHWGERAPTDLRHEVAHGYLHATLDHLPLWLDEGLAEFYEVGESHQGMNAENLESLREALADTDWAPDLQRLSELKSIGQMDHLDYAEAWLWVHFLLRTSAQRRELLLGQLHAGRGPLPSSSVGAAILRSDPEITGSLKKYLELLDPSAAR